LQNVNDVAKNRGSHRQSDPMSNCPLFATALKVIKPF